MSESAKARGVKPPSTKGHIKSAETRLKASLAQRGRVFTPEHRAKLSATRKNSGMYKGEKNPNWQGGISKLTHLIRTSFEYNKWRFEVFKRDYWTCKNCNKKDGIRIEAHHIKPFIQIIKENNIETVDDSQACEELWDINNGITLCESCHTLYHQRN
jgi:hypothetical protein